MLVYQRAVIEGWAEEAIRCVYKIVYAYVYNTVYIYIYTFRILNKLTETTDLILVFEVEHEP